MKRVLTSVLAAGAVVVLAAGPAGAQTKVRDDARGDAPRRIDVRSVKVQNNARNLAVTVRLADVVARRTSTTVVFDRPRSERTYVLATVPVAGGKYAARLTAVSEETSTRVACPGARVDVRGGEGGFVRTVVPQSCLGADAGRQELAVSAWDKHDDSGRTDDLDTQVTVRRG